MLVSMITWKQTSFKEFVASWGEQMSYNYLKENDKIFLRLVVEGIEKRKQEGPLSMNRPKKSFPSGQGDFFSLELSHCPDSSVGRAAD
jgi:hypothetical protein